MKLRGIFLFVVCAVLLSLPVLADITPPPSAVVLDNCSISRFDPDFAANNTGTPLVCSADIWAFCRVYDTTAGQITDVQFTMNSSLGLIPYPASLWPGSGSVTNGIWALDLSNQANYGSTIRLASVQATSSSGVTCSGTDAVNSAQCLVNFSSHRSISSSCSCTITAAAPVCGTNNVAVVHHTASAGCSGNQSYDTYGVCDYCDPQFVAEYTSCQTNKLSSTPFVGNATKSYTSQNPSCCATTGLTSDCNAPADSGAQVQCKMDYWTSQGKNTESNSFNQEVGQAAANFTTFTSGATAEQLINDQMARPLVFDFNGDGTTDILVQSPSGFTTYTVDMQTVEASVTSGFDDWQGQAGFYGFNNLQDSNYVWDIDLSGSGSDGVCLDDGFYNSHNITNPCVFSAQQASQAACQAVTHCTWDFGNISSPVVGGGFAAIAYNATNNHDYYVQYIYNGTWQKRFQFDIFAVYGEGATGSGVACYLNKCYFVTNNNRVVQVDTHSGVRQHVLLNAGLVFGGAMQATPAIVVQSGGSSTLVTKGIRQSTLLPAMFSCHVDGNNFLNNGSVQLCSVLDVVSTQIANVSDPIAITAADGKPELYWSEQQNGGNTSTVYVTYARLTTNGNWNTTKYGVNTVVSQGGTPQCFSNPAGATCADGGKGVYVATKWTSAVTSANFIAPTIPYIFDTRVEEASPLSSHDSTSPTAHSASTCYGDNCYMISGTTQSCSVTGGSQHAFSLGNNYALYYRSGGLWSGVTLPSSVIEPGTCTGSDGIGAWTIRTRVIAIGSLRGDLIVVTSVPPFGVGTCNGVFTASPPQFTTKVWKYTVATGTWTLLQNFGSNLNMVMSVASCAGSREATTMACNEDYCYLDGAQLIDAVTTTFGTNAGTSSGVLIARSSSAEYFQPAGIIAGFAANTSTSYGYTETPTARYLAVRGTSNALVRYSLSAPSVPGVVDTAASQDAYFLGLRGHDTDAVTYAMVPNAPSTATSNSVCLLNSTFLGGSAQVCDVWTRRVNSAGSITVIDGYQSVCAFASTWKRFDCTYQLREYNGGVSTIGSVVLRKTGAPTRDLSASEVWSRGGVDAAGKKYVAFLDMTSMPDGSVGSQYVIISEDKIFHPLIANYSTSGNTSSMPTASGSTLIELCPSGTTFSTVGNQGCKPMYVSGLGGQNSGSYTAHGSVYSEEDAHAKTLYQITATPKVEFAGLTGTGSATSSSSGVYTEYGCFRPTANTVLSKVGSFIRGDQFCPGSIATVDTDADGKSEVVAPAGVFKSSGAVVKNFTGIFQGASVEAVDLSSDSYVDFMKVTSSNIYTILSNPLQSIAVASNLSVSTLACSYDASSHSVTTTLTGVSAANPGFLVFGGNVQSNTGTPAYSASFTEDGNLVKTIILPLTASAGSYRITETAHDLVSGELASAFCTVATSGTGQSVSAPSLTCNLGTDNVDGDFNYYTRVDDVANGWLLGVGSSRPVMTGTQAWFQTASGTIDMFHGLDCRDVGLKMDVRAQSVYGNTEQSFLIIGDEGKPIGGITFSGGFINAYSTTQQQLVPLVSGVFYNMSVEFDINTQLFSVTIDNVLLATVPFANPSHGSYNTAEMTFNTGSSYVDYMRTYGTTGTVRRITNVTNAEADAYAKLDSCVRLGDQYLANGYDPHNRSSTSMHVQAYCDGILANPCTYDQLAEAVRYNGDCYEEAYQYCVSNTYPVAQGNDAAAGGFKNIPSKTSNATLDGAAVCASVLGASTTANRVAVPIFGGLWSIVTTGNNWLYLIIIVFIIILVTAISRKRSG